MENKNLVLLGLAALIGLSFTGTGNGTKSNNGLTSFIGKGSLSKGLRNNNPLNIHVSNRVYIGKIKSPKTPDFDSDGVQLERFESFEHGLAAAIQHLQKRYFDGGLGSLTCYGWNVPPKRDNILKILYTWVCGTNPSKYIDFVEQTTGFKRDQTLNLYDAQTMSVLTYAMSLYENGTSYKNKELSPDNWQKYFAKAWELK